MIPFVAAGGLLIALWLRARRLPHHRRSGRSRKASTRASCSRWAPLLFEIGGVAFSFLVPVLAGFIAYAMADRPALVPGIVGGTSR